MLVGLNLPMGIPDVGILVGRVLQLDEPKRQAVDKDDDIGAPVTALMDRELIDRKSVVVLGILEIDQPDMSAADATSLPSNLDLQRVDQHPVKGSVVDDHRRRFGP